MGATKSSLTLQLNGGEARLLVVEITLKSRKTLTRKGKRLPIEEVQLLCGLGRRGVSSLGSRNSDRGGLGLSSLKRGIGELNRKGAELVPQRGQTAYRKVPLGLCLLLGSIRREANLLTSSANARTTKVLTSVEGTDTRALVLTTRINDVFALSRSALTNEANSRWEKCAFNFLHYHSPPRCSSMPLSSLKDCAIKRSRRASSLMSPAGLSLQ